jgi:hypothetical protein
MERNVGMIDKVVRVLVAIALFSMYFILEGNLRFIAVAGIVPLLTAMISRCPLYSVFGIRTCPVSKR